MLVVLDRDFNKLTKEIFIFRHGLIVPFLRDDRVFLNFLFAARSKRSPMVPLSQWRRGRRSAMT